MVIGDAPKYMSVGWCMSKIFND